MTKALIGAGCFWGIEEYYRKLNGVIETKVGYSGGNSARPTYEEVCTGKTGHAEVVQIKFDENMISFQQILNHFWKCHDPTQLNRQGLDVGRQYRSAIFYYSKEQHNDAMESKEQTQKTLQRAIVTEIMPSQEFYLAEDYHQLMRAWELKHRALTSQCVTEHTLFREETRWPGYYYRGDHMKLDDENWHCLTVSRRDPKTGKFTIEKVPVYHIVDENEKKKAS